MWAILALGSSLAFCFVSVCDKRLLSFHFQGVPPMCLWCGTAGMVYGSIITLVVGIPDGTPGQVAVYPVGAGLLMGCSVALLFRGMRLMEASRAVAISQTNPIYVAVLAMLFLGEHISIGQWGGIGLVVAGAVLISVRLYQERPYGRIGPGVGLPSTAVLNLGDRTTVYGPAILLLSALCAAGSFVVTKASLNAHLPGADGFRNPASDGGCGFLHGGVEWRSERIPPFMERRAAAHGARDADHRRGVDACHLHPAGRVCLQPGAGIAGGGGIGDASPVRVRGVHHPVTGALAVAGRVADATGRWP